MAVELAAQKAMERTAANDTLMVEPSALPPEFVILFRVILALCFILGFALVFALFLIFLLAVFVLALHFHSPLQPVALAIGGVISFVFMTILACRLRRSDIPHLLERFARLMSRISQNLQSKNSF